jgi:CRISPR system Cascade subunit CasA
MNLLTDPWVPVQEAGKARFVRLRDVLCEESDLHIAMPRDDMELACLQLLICLTQVLFMPDDAKALKQRARAPLTVSEYEDGIADYIDWFDLNHPDTPFMQIRGVKAKEVTPIQKLFVGLPEGNNHAFFNDPGEISSVCAPIAAIALFNQAMNAPSMGGGFKGGFRGGAPITTLLKGRHLRQTIWINVLHKESVLQLIPNLEILKREGRDKPVWVEPIKEKSKIQAHEIGLLRGLLWQPAHIELQLLDEPARCDFLGLTEAQYVTGFFKEKFVYDITGDWTHPHSPRVVDLKSGDVKYRSFTTSAPAWTQLNHLLVTSQDKKEGHHPAEVVRQFRRDLANPDQLIVGGYRNKKASILQRRHEFFPLRPGWDTKGDQVSALISMAIEIKTILRNKLFGFAKASGAGSVHEKAEALYYHLSEPLIHKTLRQIDWSQSAVQITCLKDELIALSWRIFDDVTRPYAHEPKMIRALAMAKASLAGAFKKLKGDGR